MRGSMIAGVAVALAATGAIAFSAEDGAGLSGTWTLEERSSDDPVRELRGSGSGGEGSGVGKEIARGISIFGVPVGGIAFPEESVDDEDDEKDDAATNGSLRGVEHVFEATYRLVVQQNEDVTEIRYANGPSMIYRHASRIEREDGSVMRADWQNDRLSVEHELANGARVSERYWVDARTGELNWTVRLKRDRDTVNVKRIFYRARTE
jgi:hypothetical protein